MSKALFRFDAAQAVEGWTAVDDRVMGGVSRSRLRHDASGHAVFEGQVSLERNGGFASVRSPHGSFGVPGARNCVVEVRGFGKRYKLSLFTSSDFDAPSYQAEFIPVADHWSSIRLPIGGFAATFRGRAVLGAPALDPAHIRQAGLMIAGQQAGAFGLELRSISLE